MFLIIIFPLTAADVADSYKVLQPVLVDDFFESLNLIGGIQKTLHYLEIRQSINSLVSKKCFCGNLLCGRSCGIPSYGNGPDIDLTDTIKHNNNERQHFIDKIMYYLEFFCTFRPHFEFIYACLKHIIHELWFLVHIEQ